MLERRGPLSPSELLLVREHPTRGADALLEVPGLAAVSLLVRTHHERWDGTGYPLGLAGEHIPPGARVLAVCDTWWALTSPRPYARARDHEQAAAELRAASGTQLDGDAVDALLDVLSPAAEPVLV